MTTAIDVLDSAVKIGLGAIITGLATYTMARLNAKQDFAKSKRDLLERISLAMQQSAGAISKAMMIVQRLDKTADDKQPAAIIKAQEIFQNTIDEHNTAEGLAALLGSADLTAGLRLYEDSALELLDLIRTDAMNFDAQKVVIDRINEARRKISESIHLAHEKTAA